VMKGNQNAGHFIGPNKLSLDEGTYTIIARTANGQENTQSVSLTAGESRPLDMRVQAPSGNTMDQWSAKWTQQDQWSARKGGGFVLYQGMRGAGSITFTVKMRKKNLFSNPHIRWVVNFIDDNNYILFELDNKSFSRTEVVNGSKQSPLKKAYNLGEASFIHLNIDVSSNSLQQRCNATNNTWQTLDNWQLGASTAPSMSKAKSFA